MSEGLATRVKRLISSGAHGVVDSLERAAPEALMREAIRELDRAIDDVRDELVRTVAAGHHARRRLAMTREKIAEFDEKACIAVAEGREDLAKVALSRQIDVEGHIPDLERTIAEAGEKQGELDGFVAALGARKKAMETDLAEFQAASRDAMTVSGPSGHTGRTKAERQAEKAQSAFERAFSSGTGLASSVRLERDSAAKLHELDQMTRELEVGRRLAAIRSTRQAV